MIFFYDLIFLFLFGFALVFFMVKNIRRFGSDVSYRWKERIGVWDFSKIKHNQPLLWFHCASIGEVKVIEPIIKNIPEYNFILTTTTPSACRYALDSKITDAVYLAPLDLSFVINAIIRRIRPLALVIVETEIWPALISTAFKNGIKIISINSRLSKKSYPYYRFFKPLCRKVLSKISFFCARSNSDAKRFAELGVPEAKIKVTGNIKYDNSFYVPDFTREKSGFSEQDLIFVAGSIRGGEEALIIDIWLEAMLKYPNLKLIIAPRHLKNVGRIERILKNRKANFALFSKYSKQNIKCLIIDEFGILLKFYCICDFAFVGGSLVDKGGQNPIEPAALSKPVIFGSSMWNFSDEADILLKNSGAFCVKNKKELFNAIDRLVGDQKLRKVMGDNAKKGGDSQKNATERTIKIIKEII